MYYHGMKIVFNLGILGDNLPINTHVIYGLYRPWKSKTKQRMVFSMIHVKDSLLPMGKVWFLDFLGRDFP